MSFTKRLIEKLQAEGLWPEKVSDEDYLYETRDKKQDLLQIQEHEKRKKTAENEGIPPEMV